MDIAKFFTDNYQWIFSGIGVAIILFFLNLGRKHESSKIDKTSTTQIGNKVGGDQAGRDIKK